MAGLSKISRSTSTTRSTLFLSTLLFGLNFRAALSQQSPNASAINWPPSGAWEGNDGDWATFFIRVGTPAQIVRVLPATTWQEIWVVDSAACADSTPAECDDLRGGTVTVNSSSTWSERGLFLTDLAKDVGYAANGLYGDDTVGLGNTNAGATLEDQIVVAVNSQDWYIGIFGLGDQPTNFTDFNNPQPSFLTSLYDKGLIPSLSWGYQVGANYRGKTSSASLVFGGYDTSKYVDNDILFTQANDFTHRFQVSLSSLKVDGIYVNGQQGTAELLDGSYTRQDGPQYVSLDSATPYLWLPNATCAIFEAALNLTWSESTGLYLMSDDAHTQLADLNPTFTFTIADGIANDTKMTIEVPYTAFSLQATGQDILGTDDTSWYFPLKRLPEGGTPRLGRSFMQEIYLFAEFHFGSFRVFQADFSTAASNIVSHQPTQIAITKEGGDSGTPLGAIIGGAVGGVVVIAALVGGFIFYRRRQKQKAGKDKPSTSDPSTDPNSGYVPEIDGAVKMPHELSEQGAWGRQGGDGGAWQDNQQKGRVVEVQGVHEVHGASTEKHWNEADGTPITKPYGQQQGSPYYNYAELSGGDVISSSAQELPAGETRRDGK
ncbi:Candidapepsin-8 [Dactylella cylindrospora]|nr:Candidapepsin-8 [Dactylella cylindrospora]